MSLPMVAEVHRLLLAHRGPRQAAGGGAAATAAGEGAGGAAGAAARTGEGPAGQGTASQQQAQGVASGSRGGSKSSTSGAGPDAAAEVARDPGQHHTASSTPSARGVLWGSFNHSIQVGHGLCYLIQGYRATGPQGRRLHTMSGCVAQSAVKGDTMRASCVCAKRARVVCKSAAQPVSLPALQVACYNTDPTIPLFTSAPRALLLLAANARGGGALGRVQVRGEGGPVHDA